MIRLLNKTPDFVLGIGEKRDAFLDWHDDKIHAIVRIVKKTTFLIRPNDDIKWIFTGLKVPFFLKVIFYMSGILGKEKQ